MAEIELKEATGKTVKRMYLEFDSEYNIVAIEFTDGTRMAVDVVPAVKIRAQYQDIATGDIEIKRTYPAKINVAGQG